MDGRSQGVEREKLFPLARGGLGEQGNAVPPTTGGGASIGSSHRLTWILCDAYKPQFRSTEGCIRLIRHQHTYAVLALSDCCVRACRKDPMR
jgi:hypothetical protein